MCVRRIADSKMFVSLDRPQPYTLRRLESRFLRFPEVRLIHGLRNEFTRYQYLADFLHDQPSPLFLLETCYIYNLEFFAGISLTYPVHSKGLWSVKEQDHEEPYQHLKFSGRVPLTTLGCSSNAPSSSLSAQSNLPSPAPFKQSKDLIPVNSLTT